LYDLAATARSYGDIDEWYYYDCNYDC